MRLFKKENVCLALALSALLATAVDFAAFESCFLNVMKGTKER